MGKSVMPPGDGVEVIELKAALEERYLAYALSTIMHRALPKHIPGPLRDPTNSVSLQTMREVRQKRLQDLSRDPPTRHQ